MLCLFIAPLSHVVSSVVLLDHHPLTKCPFPQTLNPKQHSTSQLLLPIRTSGMYSFFVGQLPVARAEIATRKPVNLPFPLGFRVEGLKISLPNPES